jgi:hypothetical protein
MPGAKRGQRKTSNTSPSLLCSSEVDWYVFTVLPLKSKLTHLSVGCSLSHLVSVNYSLNQAESLSKKP